MCERVESKQKIKNMIKSMYKNKKKDKSTQQVMKKSMETKQKMMMEDKYYDECSYFYYLYLLEQSE